MTVLVGDLVELKCGGMTMVVSSVAATTALCMWHTQDGFLQQAHIVIECLCKPEKKV